MYFVLSEVTHAILALLQCVQEEMKEKHEKELLLLKVNNKQLLFPIELHTLCIYHITAELGNQVGCL